MGRHSPPVTPVASHSSSSGAKGSVGADSHRTTREERTRADEDDERGTKEDAVPLFTAVWWKGAVRLLFRRRRFFLHAKAIVDRAPFFR